MTTKRIRALRADRVHSSGPAPPSGRVRIAQLSCQHTNEFGRPYPDIDDEVYCPSCKNYSRVLLISDMYQVRCRTCHYGRGFGRAHHDANRAAREHSRRHGHTVDLLDGGTVEHTYEPSGGTIPLDTDPPPF